ncbi:Major sperm protein [Caenorhabditis elegans]|uniref:Major sperm protein n=1 Tax=Caenorhabditis elegans TaxID=6239 RepID=P91330_CAEEL|nr:Major sperm protein [Caenorhabditis elegans]CCD68188.1 Major sperm protein [Caenorhabditis elegans]|eukprot:NP_495345.1 Major sperm protein [Caenorhabditis elegans]
METKQSMDYIIKGPGGTTKPIAPKLITVNPLNIIIESNSGQIDKTLELKNIYPCRIAFRVRTNGPTRYTVCPSKGFLSNGEKVAIQITLIDGTKYQSNHQFIVQAMPSPGDFADRKFIWKQPNFLGIFTNTRVKTMRPAQSLPKSNPKSPAKVSTPTDSGMSSPVASSESLVTPSVPSWSKSPSSPIDHGKFAENINDLSVQVKKAIDEKNTRTSEMVSVVNQIKAVEVDLDRQAQLVNELSERVKRGEIQYSNLVMHERSLRVELGRLKNNEAESIGQ